MGDETRTSRLERLLGAQGVAKLASARVMVIGIGAILAGLFIAVLGALADKHKMIPLGMGLLLLAIGITAYSYSKKKS